MKFVPKSRRYAALAVFMTALVGITTVANAQRRDRQTPGALGNLKIPLRALPGVGDNRFLAPSIPVRQWDATSATQAKAGQKNPTRVQIGGPNGANVIEKVVDATFRETEDEINPYWTDDEQVLYYAGNPVTRTGTVTSSTYQLFRLSASVANNPSQTGAGTPVVMTREPLADHKWPVPSRSGGQLAFIKSVDNRAINDVAKVWHLYIATTPAPGATIDSVPGGPSNLLNLTGDLTRFRGKRFVNVERAAWLGPTDLVFSALLEGDTVYHLYTINTVGRRVTQLTDGAADERNPAVSPDGRFIAFDSNAQPRVAGDIYVGGSIPKTETVDGNPAVATGVNSTRKRNIFVMSTVNGATVQFTNRYTGAPDSDDVQPAFSSLRTNPFTNQAGTQYYIAFASTRQPDLVGAPTAFTAGGTTHDIYTVRATATATGVPSLLVEGTPTSGLQSAKQIDSVDPAYLFDDTYPTWSPFINVNRVAFQSNRVGDLSVNNFGNGFRSPNAPTPSNYNDICLATVVDVAAPTLVRYDTSTSTGEIIHINPVRGGALPDFDPNVSSRTRESGIFPGQEYFFTVRMEDRESGIQSVWLQFKNPNSKYQSATQNGGVGVEHKEYAATHRAWLSTTDQPSWRGTDGPERVGAEYEAQAITLDGSQYVNHRFNNRNPGSLYEAGLDDATVFSGSSRPPLDGLGGRPNVWLRLQPLTDPGTGVAIRPADGRGGVLYGAKWRIPTEASDWYIDVIAYDNATNPYSTTAGRSNWIIYDNVWGFSSALPLNPADYDVLFVSDYTLGQKFFSSRGRRAPQNDQPLGFGAESYYTDSDMTRYPSERNIDMSFWSGGQAPPAPGATDPRFWSSVGPNVGGIGSTVGGALRYQGGVAVNPGIMHPLGVGSYVDRLISFTRVPETNGETYALPNTGSYTIWRTLSRGAVPQELLDSYLPYNAPAPADVVVGETAERSVKVNKRVIVWAAPFIGNIFIGSGTLADLKTQERLTKYVQAGGGLLVSGMDIGWALAGNGQNNAFYNSVLNAQFQADDGANATLFVNPVGATAFNNDSWQPLALAYARFDGTNWVYSPPRQIGLAYSGPDLNGRGDGSPVSDTWNGYIDSITPGAGATREYTYTNGNVGAIRTQNANGGLVYYLAFGFESMSNEWYTFSRTVGSVTRTMIANQGRRAQVMNNFILESRTGMMAGQVIDDNGSPVADALVRAVTGAGAASGTALTDASGNFVIQGLRPAAYALDGYKQGFYTQHATGSLVQAGNTTRVSLKLKRANPGQLSNIRKSNPLSTTDPEGGVFALDGRTGLGGVEVQARRMNADGTMNIATAISSDGTDGRRPGAYLVRDLLVWDDGYEIIVNSATRPELNSAGRPQFNTDGSLRTVANPLYKPDLTTVLVGRQPQPTVVLGSGTLIQNRPVTGQPERWRLIVVEDQTSQMDFKLGGAAQKVTGQVLKTSDNTPLVGAFVTAVDESSGATIASATTDVNGNYTLITISGSLDVIPSSTYTVTASALGYSTVSFPNIVVGGTGTKVLPVFRLTALPDGSVSGTVQKVTGSALEGNVTIRFYIVQSGVVSPTPAKTLVTTATLTTDVAGYGYNFKTNLSPGEYEVIADKVGLTSDPTPLPRLIVTSGVERKSYNFRMQPAKVFSDGIQLISTPGRYDYTTITTRGIFGLTSSGDNDGDGIPNTANDRAVYNQFNVADWTGSEYNLSPDLQVQVGKGYFVRFGAPSSVTQVGVTLPGDTFTLTLAPGWNLIGHPFVNPTSPNTPAPDLDLYANGQVQEEGGVVMSMTEAVRLGKVRGALFGYSGSNNGSQYFQVNVMKPWFGYWFRNLTNQPLKLILRYPASRAVKVSSKPQTRAQAEAGASRVIETKSALDYRIQLAVRQGNNTDTDNTVGVSPEAKDGFDTRFDTQKPPMLAQVPGIYLAIEGENESGRSAGFADVIRSATPGMKSWNFTVESSQTGEATLFWPNSNRLDKGIDPYLVDTETGKRVAIRSASAYRYQAVSKVPHRFRIEVMPAKTRPLAITNVKVAGGSRGQFGASYRLSFNATQAADVEVEVQSFGGRTVRRLQTRASGVGETGVVWDGRDGQGATLPAGAYILVLTARDETGATVRQAVPFVSVR